VLLDEIGAATVTREQVVTNRDALHDRPPARRQQPLQGREVGRPPAFADRFEHLDRNDMVELLPARSR
jgi:hypothetical protein